jgi:hypothetical protein
MEPRRKPNVLLKARRRVPPFDLAGRAPDRFMARVWGDTRCMEALSPPAARSVWSLQASSSVLGSAGSSTASCSTKSLSGTTCSPAPSAGPRPRWRGWRGTCSRTGSSTPLRGSSSLSVSGFFGRRGEKRGRPRVGNWSAGCLPGGASSTWSRGSSTTSFLAFITSAAKVSPGISAFSPSEPFSSWAAGFSHEAMDPAPRRKGGGRGAHVTAGSLPRGAIGELVTCPYCLFVLWFLNLGTGPPARQSSTQTQPGSRPRRSRST